MSISRFGFARLRPRGLRLARSSLLLLLSACAAQSPAARASTTSRPRAAAPELVEHGSIPPSQITVLAGLLPAMPTPVTSFAAASDERYLYTLGGYHGEPHSYSREGQERGLARLALDGSGSWEPLSSLPRGLQGLAMVHYAGKLCRVGGTEARERALEPRTAATREPHAVRSRRASRRALGFRRSQLRPDAPG